MKTLCSQCGASLNLLPGVLAVRCLHCGHVYVEDGGVGGHVGDVQSPRYGRAATSAPLAQAPATTQQPHLRHDDRREDREDGGPTGQQARQSWISTILSVIVAALAMLSGKKTSAASISKAGTAARGASKTRDRGS